MVFEKKGVKLTQKVKGTFLYQHPKW